MKDVLQFYFTLERECNIKVKTFLYFPNFDFPANILGSIGLPKFRSLRSSPKCATKNFINNVEASFLLPSRKTSVQYFYDNDYYIFFGDLVVVGKKRIG